MKKPVLSVAPAIAATGACLAALSACAVPAKATQYSNSRGGSLPDGHMSLVNNWWGVGSGVSGWQDVWLYDTNSWGTDWNWSGGKSYNVKTYAEMVDGWNWGGFNGSPFPYQISGGHSVNVWWYFNNNNSGTQDVSFDCFFSPSSNPGYQNPSDEMMVWLQANGGAGPLGSYKTTLSVDGASWNVYQGYGSWNVVSFVRNGNVSGASLNLMDFARAAASKGFINWSRYFLNVDTGTEIFEGSGDLKTTSFGAP